MAVDGVTRKRVGEIEKEIRELVQDWEIELMGVADLVPFQEPGADIPEGSRRFLAPYRRAVVMGIPWGVDAGRSLLYEKLEPLAFTLSYLLWDHGFNALTIHGDEEFVPGERLGLLSLKALARQAGLGWQGRSLLIVNPEHGPLHRLIAVLTDLDLAPDRPIRNRCGKCSACVEACPQGALTLVEFQDRPQRREDVLAVEKCIGNDTCPHCIEACPWLKGSFKASPQAGSRRQARS